MQKRKLFLLLVFFISILTSAQDQSQERDTNVVRLNLGKNEYKKVLLSMSIRRVDDMDTISYFPGLFKDDSWTFEYPCSLYEKCTDFRLIIPTHTDTVTRNIAFEQIIDNDTIKAPEFMFDNVDTVFINAGLKIRTDTGSVEKAVDYA